jgi:hypothetical protein
MTGRWPLLALPVLTVAVVALALLTAAAPRPFRAARIWGGPTDGARLSLRVEVVDVIESSGEVVERPLPDGKAVLLIRAGRFEAARPLTLDAEGAAEVALDVPETKEPLVASVVQGENPIALGRIGLEGARWAKAAKRRGGFIDGHGSGGHEVRVAPERGAFAVPFEEGLVVEVSRAGNAVAGASLVVEATGGRVVPREARTDAHGRARFSLTPEEHALGLNVVVSEGDVRTEASFGLPIVPGALRARLLGGALVVESPVPRDVAYYALVTEGVRLAGGRITFEANGATDISARVPLPVLPLPPSHAVVSSERDLRSAAAVGWPLGVPPDGTPATTFDAVDALLLDGRTLGAARENSRRGRVRWATVAFCAVAVLLELALLFRHTRERDRQLDEHLAREGIAAEQADKLAPARSSALLFAVAAVALGFLLLAIAAVLRLE